MLQTTTGLGDGSIRGCGMINRRCFLKTLAAASAGVLVATRVRPAFAALPKAKITKISIYEPPNLNSLFNQSNMVVLVETDANITGIGEGGSRDTIEPCGGRQIYHRPNGSLTNW